MYYTIGGHHIRITTDVEGMDLETVLPSFRPFREEKGGEMPLLFHMKVQQQLKMIPQSECHLIRDIDTGNGMTRVDKLPDGGYQFLVRDVSGYACALLITSKHFDDCRCKIRGPLGIQRFALNNSMMLAYAFSAAYFDTLLIHASVIRHAGSAYAFTAKSGTGKSTQVANWLRHIPGCDMMNDDNPIIRLVDGKPVLYGSPWSGKTPCYRNISAPLGSIMLIERDTYNHVVPQQPLTAFSTLLTACSSMKWDSDIYQRVCQSISKFIEGGVKVASLHCLPDAESAEVCRKYLED